MKFDVPSGTPRSTCQSCHAPIFWVKTAALRRMFAVAPLMEVKTATGTILARTIVGPPVTLGDETTCDLLMRRP